MKVAILFIFLISYNISQTPHVFIGGNFIGGVDLFYEHEEGKIVPLLIKAGAMQDPELTNS